MALTIFQNQYFKNIPLKYHHHHHQNHHRHRNVIIVVVVIIIIITNACSETVTELEPLRTVKAKPEFSGFEF